MFKNPISSIHDSDSFNFSDTIDIMNSLKGGATAPATTAAVQPTLIPITQRTSSNNINVVIVALIAVLYMVVNHEATPSEVINVIDNPIFKLSILGAIIYLSKNNPMISLVAIVIFCLTIQTLQQKVPPPIVDVEDEDISDEVSDEIDEIIATELDPNVNINNVEPTNVDELQLANINDTMNNSLTQGSDALNTLQNSTSELIDNDRSIMDEDVANYSSDTMDGISGTIDNTMAGASNLMEDVNNSDMMQNVSNNASNMMQNVSNTASDMMQNVSNDPSNMMENVSNNASNAMENVSNTVGDIDAQGMLENASNAIGEINPFSDSSMDNFEQIY